MSSFTRRNFLRGATAGVVGASFAHNLSSPVFAEKAAKTKVIIVRDEDAVDEKGKRNPKIVETMLDSAVCRLSGREDPVSAWKKYIHADDTVGIKMTVYMISTSEEVVKAVQSGAQKAGVKPGKILVGDRGKSPGKKKPVTALVNVPSLKAHHVSGIGCAIKNYIIYHSNPGSLHANSCADLGKAWQLPVVKNKTRLIVVDALEPFFDKGPQMTPKYRWSYKGLIVGTDPVAVDTVCLRIIQAKRNAYKKEPWPVSPPPKSIPLADTKYHIGTSDPAKIQLVKLGWKGDILI